MTGITLKRLASFLTSVKKLPASQTRSNTVTWELLFALDIRNILFKKKRGSDIQVTFWQQISKLQCIPTEV